MDQNKRYQNSQPMEFDGDIIITDPCYIIRAEHHGTTPVTQDDWAACRYGVQMEALGICHSMTRDTLYGDWGCTVFDLDTGEEIGEFCADAGLVSVFLLGEVLRYNPDFDWYKTKPWTTTLHGPVRGGAHRRRVCDDNQAPQDRGEVGGLYRPRGGARRQQENRSPDQLPQ